MAAECMECGDKVSGLYDDPRDPPLDTAPCICADCKHSALEIGVDDARDYLTAAISELKHFEQMLIQKKASDSDTGESDG